MMIRKLFLSHLNKFRPFGSGYKFPRYLHSAKHSNTLHKERNNNRYEVLVVPALSDNFMYILADYCLKSAIAVDPVEPEKVFRVLDSKNISLTAVLTTHHHLDHDGGNEIIAKCLKNIPIYGGDERIKAMTNKLSHSEEFDIGELSIKCLHTPCHTSGHVCYFTEADNLGHICFTGDTLFVGGCGRFFEGTAAHMLKSLNVLASLPLKTNIYCGHEYTISKMKAIEEKLKKGEHSVPSTIEEELKYNPFMRTNKKSVQLYTGQADPVSVMKVLREKKDSFK